MRAESKGPILVSIEKIPRVHRLINLILYYTCSAVFSATSDMYDLEDLLAEKWGGRPQRGISLAPLLFRVFVSAVVEQAFAFAVVGERIAYQTQSCPRLYQTHGSGHNIFGQPKCYAYSILRFREEQHFTGRHFEIFVGNFIDWGELRCLNIRSWIVTCTNPPGILLNFVNPFDRFSRMCEEVRGSLLWLLWYIFRSTSAVFHLPREGQPWLLWFEYFCVVGCFFVASGDPFGRLFSNRADFCDASVGGFLALMHWCAFYNTVCRISLVLLVAI